MAHYDNFHKKNTSLLGGYTAKMANQFFLKQILQTIPNPKKVLEIGPGTGFMAKYFNSDNCEYLAYEPNKLIGDQLKELGVSIKSELVPPIKETDEEFDLVIASHVLEHMNDAKMAFEFIKEISRVLKKDGTAAIVCPNINSWKWDFYDCDYTHSFEVTPNRLKQMYEDAGLELKCLKLRYGNFGHLIGFPIDFIISILGSALRFLFPTHNKLLKAKLTFHANVIGIAVKQ